jgi:6-pyruvoyltetrahydropterin/6-carboxytetrahydropterin synthase
MKYRSTKFYGPERGYAVAYRQWRAESHCNKIHGYAMSFLFTFEAEHLDVRNWVVDFGSLKSLKDKLDEWFDHTCLVATDDPEYAFFEEMHRRKLIKMVAVDKTGCEGLAEWLHDYVNNVWMVDNGYAGRCRCVSVEVRETPANSASFGDF